MSVGDKRAALELHKMNPQDREWVLGRLGSAERARVAPLLAELQAMNVRFDIGSDAGVASAHAKEGASADTVVAVAPGPSARSMVAAVPAGSASARSMI